MKLWEISFMLFLGSLAITIAFWMLGLPFFFVFLFLPLVPFFFKEACLPALPGMRMGDHRQRELLPLRCDSPPRS